MKSRFLLLAAALSAPTLALAHPGHDGDHEFVWDFDHLASHPLATLGYVAIAGLVIWGAVRLLRSRRNERR